MRRFFKIEVARRIRGGAKVRGGNYIALESLTKVYWPRILRISAYPPRYCSKNKLSKSITSNNWFARGEVYYCGWNVTANAAVDHNVHFVF
jgi:hypothetical protein